MILTDMYARTYSVYVHRRFPFNYTYRNSHFWDTDCFITVYGDYAYTNYNFN